MEQAPPALAASKNELESLVGLGLTDEEIAQKLTFGRHGAWWAKERRLALGVHRRKGGAQQVARAVIDPVFAELWEKDEWFDRILHGEADIHDVCAYTGCSYNEVYWEFRAWSARNPDQPLETQSMRRARSVLEDHDSIPTDKIAAVFGRRYENRRNGPLSHHFIDGRRVGLTEAMELADTEARELGLPGILKRRDWHG
jgi:hypothetical protein